MQEPPHILWYESFFDVKTHGFNRGNHILYYSFLRVYYVLQVLLLKGVKVNGVFISVFDVHFFVNVFFHSRRVQLSSMKMVGEKM